PGGICARGATGGGIAMIRVRAPSRLHFGLFSLPSADGQPTHWPDREGRLVLPARHFGGVGLMINKPGLELTVAPSRAWSAEGAGAERALSFARRAESMLRVGPCHIKVEHCPPEHIGLGTGTQLGLSVAYALEVRRGLIDYRPEPITALAQATGRGK